MTNIVMLQTRRGADGKTLQRYEKGATYDVRDNLAAAFLSAGYAERADVIYYTIKWKKSGKITRSPMDGAMQHFLERGIAELVEA